MEPQELFHDHPVIDEQDDGNVRMYFHDLPPLLLKCPYIITPAHKGKTISTINTNRHPPDDEDKTTD